MLSVYYGLQQRGRGEGQTFVEALAVDKEPRQPLYHVIVTKATCTLSIFQQKFEIQITSWIYSHQESERVTDLTTVFFDQPCSWSRLNVTELENGTQRQAWCAQGHTVCVREEFFRLGPLPFLSSLGCLPEGKGLSGILH